MQKRVKVNLNLANIKIPTLIKFAGSVHQKLTGNVILNSPRPTLAVFAAAIDKLSKISAKAYKGRQVDTAEMYVNVSIVKEMLRELAHYVEDTANKACDGDLVKAREIIESAGMKAKKLNPRQKQTFTAISGRIVGTVELRAQGVRQAMHFWEYTLTLDDPNSWVAVLPTWKSKTTVTGLESGKRYYFRHRTIGKNGVTNWEGGQSAMVH